MLEYINYLNLDDSLKNKVIDLARSDKVNVLSLVNKCKKGNFNCLLSKNDLTRLAVMIELISYTKSKYDELNVPENILIDTLDDIRIWCENNENKGLNNFNWIKNHINAKLFKIGRLQYELYKCDNKRLDYDYFPFNYGENLIYIHIPQGEKLVYADCLDSMRKAIEFFDKYFPDYNYQFFYCESWLLYDDNYQFMEISSNIMQFSTFFDVIVSYHNDKQAIERIFGKRQMNKKKYQECTTLQRNAKKFLIEGGKLGMGIGIINKNDLL